MHISIKYTCDHQSKIVSHSLILKVFDKYDRRLEVLSDKQGARVQAWLIYLNMQAHCCIMSKLTHQTKADTFRLQTYLETLHLSHFLLCFIVKSEALQLDFETK